MSNDDQQQWESRYGARGVLLRKGIAELVRRSMRREPPFDALHVESCLEHYREYLGTLPPDTQRMSIEAIIRTYLFRVCGEMFDDPESREKFHEFDKAWRAWSHYTSEPIFLRQVLLKGGEVRKIVTNAFSVHCPAFVRDKSEDRYTLRLSAPHELVKKIFVDIDFGSHGPGHFAVYVGTTDPYFCALLGRLMCLRASKWWYVSAQECEEAAEAASRLVAFLLPVLEGTLRDALEVDGASEEVK